MSYIRGEDRGQVALLPAMIEDYLAADAPVPVIEAFAVGTTGAMLVMTCSAMLSSGDG